MSEAIIHGFVLSFGLILAFGAQNIFLFNQGATHKKLRQTMPAVITASICDTILIVLAVLGVSLIVITMPVFQMIFFAAGFFFLIYIGWSIWSSVPVEVNKQYGAMGAKKQIMFAISVSLLNPHAILDTVGVIGTNSLRYSTEPELIGFTVACIAVSWISFIGLVIMGRTIRTIDQDGKIIVFINKISAVIIWGISVYLGYQLYLIS